MAAKIIALIPAFNEQERIFDTITGLREALENVDVVVVDDGSTDKTARIAEEAGAKVVAMPRNLGKGNALNAAFEAVNPPDDTLLLLIDADLGSTSGEAVKLVEPVLSGEADMAVAKFGPPLKKGGFGLVKGLARRGIKRLGGMEVAAPLSGQRAMRAAVLKAVGGFEPGYGMETGLTIDALRHGFRLIEVETDMRHHETGRDLAGFKHRGRQFIAVAWVLLRKMLSRRRAVG